MKNEKLVNDYKAWILAQKIPDATITDAGDSVKISTGYATGEVNFHDLDVFIIEMIVTNLADGENKFYLHFELKDLAYAEELFGEMADALADLKQQQTLKILLSCTGGLTTGFFAEKLNDAAKILALDYKFDAVPFHKLYSVARDYSMILLAPQIAYQAAKAAEILHDKLVLKIPPKVFAGYDSAEMLKFIRAELDSWKKTAAERFIAKVRKGIRSDAKILSIAIMPSHSQSRIAYRIYEKGAPVLDETVIKGRLNVLRDLQDILDTVSCRCESFDAVGIAISGAVHDGHLDLKDFMNQRELNLQKLLEDKYGVPVTITNNLKSAALGYYVQQEKFENILFVSRPRGFRASGLGMVLNGRVFNGAHNMAGEIRYASQSIVSKEDWERNEIVEPEKVLDAISFEIRAGIAIVDPELICVRSELTPDLEKIKSKLTEFIPAEFLPEFVYLRDEEMAEYVLLGQMILSLENLEAKR